ncbi:MAG: type CRISPR-associated endonuclease Cas1 [Pseudomonadota bacterium]|jgi:CRISPR-associated protein Cas1
MQIAPSDLKTILHSRRANIYYLEHCRVLVNGGRVEYVTDAGKRSLYWNIPIANTTTILLGTGTSLTQAAMRELAKAGVLVGFCGGGGTPLFSATEVDVEVAWMSPQSEYRPTEYLQHWVRFWFDDSLRLQAAQAFQQIRLERIRQEWGRNKRWVDGGTEIDMAALGSLLDRSRPAITAAADNTGLLTEEARLTKQLYKLASQTTRYGEFARSSRGESTDLANRFLDHGNYLAYGLAATATWVLGLPHGLAVLHGKTRKGGLVFDVADLVKDATILPQAFVSAMRGDSEREFREACIEQLTRSEALDFMIDTLKEVALRLGRLAGQPAAAASTEGQGAEGLGAEGQGGSA